jgi:hypothetical protein
MVRGIIERWHCPLLVVNVHWFLYLSFSLSWLWTVVANLSSNISGIWPDLVLGHQFNTAKMHYTYSIWSIFSQASLYEFFPEKICPSLTLSVPCWRMLYITLCVTYVPYRCTLYINISLLARLHHFYAPTDHKMSGALCHGLCIVGIGVHKHLISVNYRTNSFGLLGVTRGRFLSMISSATHPRCPLRLPSWIWFLSIRRQTPASIHPIFLWFIGGD